MKDLMIGVDLAKNVFQVHGALRTEEVQFRKKLTRSQFPVFMAQQDPCLVIFEACGGAHYWAHEMTVTSHEVKLIAPQYVRPFVSVRKMMRLMLKRLSSQLASPRCALLSLKPLSSNHAQRHSVAENDWFISALPM